MHLVRTLHGNHESHLPQLWRRSAAPPHKKKGKLNIMSRRLISSGSAFEKVAGYSRAVVDGDWIFVSGTTGFNYATMTISDDVVEQTRQIFRTLEAALAEAGCSLKDVVRARYIIVDQADWPIVAPVFGEYFGEIRPASTAIVCGLVDARMKIEIEVTAKKQG
jgi:enamine deaminase RidA (YjgF/YER057c/UK114 family)